jgi:hypothetical protein
MVGSSETRHELMEAPYRPIVPHRRCVSRPSRAPSKPPSAGVHRLRRRTSMASAGGSRVRAVRAVAARGGILVVGRLEEEVGGKRGAADATGPFAASPHQDRRKDQRAPHQDSPVPGLRSPWAEPAARFFRTFRRRSCIIRASLPSHSETTGRKQALQDEACRQAWPKDRSVLTSRPQAACRQAEAPKRAGAIQLRFLLRGTCSGGCVGGLRGPR